MEKGVPSGAVSLISLRKCFLTIIIRKIYFQMFDKMETLVFARKMELVDLLISIFNGVLRKGFKGEKIVNCAPNRLQSQSI